MWKIHLSVVYSSDNNYAQHVGVSLASLFENNKHFGSIYVFVIENDITNKNKSNLQEICDIYGRTLKFIRFGKISDRLNLNINNSISVSAYARLFLPSILDNSIDKILYLDCDTIINESLSSLWQMDMSKYYVAGVLDTVSDETKLKVNMNPSKSYINSGMLLINLKRWREEDIESKFLRFIDYFKGQVFHHDQGTINGVLNEKFLILHPRYNCMSSFFTLSREEMIEYYGLRGYYGQIELIEAMNNPVIIHFTPAFVNRPWIKGCKHPLVSLYRKYQDMTPWKGTELSNDKRARGEKLVAFLYNNLPFKMANSVRNTIFK